MKKLRLVAVGKIRTPACAALIREYQGRLLRLCPFEETIVRDGDASLPTGARVEEEGARLVRAMREGEKIFCLDERGEALSSAQFAERLGRLWESASGVACFVVGGPFGLSDRVRARADALISLGPMTLPHELARVVLWEQLYRAQCIVRHIPYHHA